MFLGVFIKMTNIIQVAPLGVSYRVLSLEISHAGCYCKLGGGGGYNCYSYTEHLAVIMFRHTFDVHLSNARHCLFSHHSALVYTFTRRSSLRLFLVQPVICRKHCRIWTSVKTNTFC